MPESLDCNYKIALHSTIVGSSSHEREPANGGLFQCGRSAMPERRRSTHVLLHGTSADRVAGPDAEARTRAKERLLDHPEVLTPRACACGAVLSRYNPMPLCQPCERAKRFEDIAAAAPVG